jgi:hypothetical protein
MHGRTNTLTDELRPEAKQLDDACRRYLGVSGAMFRTVKFVFYIATLVFSGYLIELAGVEPFLAMLFAALLIAGPEAAETMLIERGVIDEKNGQE